MFARIKAWFRGLCRGHKIANYPTATALSLVRFAGEGFTRIGGDPIVPPGFVWPMRGDVPLGFLAQVDISEARSAWGNHLENTDDTLSISELPEMGALYFFIDYENEPWGIDANEVGSFSVIHCPDITGATPMRPPSISENKFDGLAEGVMSLSRIESCLPLELWSNNWTRKMCAKEDEAFNSAMEKAFNNNPRHQLLGFPDPVQYPGMNEECAEMAKKAFGLTSVNPNDWKLLLQIDTDDDLDLIWGDMGKVYFWIDQNDLKSHRFDRAWAILQCS